MSSERFQPIAALEMLSAHRVRFVVIGGFAASLLGSPMITGDLDVCYARDGSNLVAMAAALREMHAKLRGAPADVPFILDARSLKEGDRFTFITDLGSLAIMGAPDGVSGFDELDANASDMDLDVVAVRVCSLDDLIRMKLAAGRPKDLLAAEELGALRDEVDGEP